MSGDPFKRVTTGEPLQIPADTWNAFLEARDWVQRQARVGAGEVKPLRPTLVHVHNDTGGDLARFNVGTVSGMAITPTDNLLEWQARQVYTLAAPVEGDTPVIVQGPIADGEYGSGIIWGPSCVQVSFSASDHTFATVSTGTTANLESASAGEFRIVYAESTSGTQWCVVVPASAAGAGNVVVEITAVVSATEYTVKVYGDGRYEDDGTPKSETDTGKTLFVFNRTDGYLQIGDTVSAQPVDDHYEVDGEVDLSYLPVGSAGDDNADLFLRYNDSTKAHESVTLGDISKNSITADAGQLQLDGDQLSPGANKYYGTAGGGKGWQDATALDNFTVKADAGDATPGYLDAKVDDSTIEVTGSDVLAVKDDGITGAKLAPAVAGDGLVQDGSGNLDVNVDTVGVEVVTVVDYNTTTGVLRYGTELLTITIVGDKLRMTLDGTKSYTTIDTAEDCP
jgi:hypothetical protein